MNSSPDLPGAITRSMAAKRKAKEAKTDVVPTMKSRFCALRQHNDESRGVITRSMAAKIKLKAAEEEKATTNVVIAKPGKRRRQKSSKKLHFSGSYYQQRWSLPESLIYYMIKNPTPESHAKLIQCCKYFFAKISVLVIRDLKFENGKWHASIDNEPLDIAKTAESKLWIYGTLIVESFTNQNILASLIPKINRCDIQSLYLSTQTVSYRDFTFIASSVEYFNGFYVNVNDDNDSIVPFEKIVEALPKVHEIYYSCHPAAPNSLTWKELVKIPHFSQFRFLYLAQIPETFDLDAFYAYMKQNKFTKLQLSFHDSISETFKNRLEAIVDEIIAAETYDYTPAILKFPGLDSSKSKKLLHIYIDH